MKSEKQMLFETAIQPLSYFTGLDSFCDENGKPNDSFPNMHWRTEFTARETGTPIENYIATNSAEVLQKLIDMGFKEGYGVRLENLENWLEANK